MAFDPSQLMILPVCAFSLAVRECAQGLVAVASGDPTPRERGRMTLHPLPHLDVLGTIVVPAVLLAFQSPLLFGWAKPMPIALGNLRDPRNDPAKVALAGPLANAVLALAFAALAAAAPSQGFWAPLAAWCRAGVAWNCSLALIHLIPVPPLAGAFVLMRFLRLRHIIALHHFRGLAFLALVALLAWPPAASLLFGPLRVTVNACLALFAGRAGVAS